MPAYHVRITGQVQGVFYRQSAFKEAKKLKISGWVQNMPDGSVEALVGGKESKLSKMLAWFHVGPESAKVSSVATEPVEDEPTGPFEIRE